MFAITFLSICFLAALMALVRAEVYAGLHAWHYASKHEGTLTSRAKVALARYQWASPAFHEVQRKGIGQKPAYRASLVMLVWLVTATLAAVMLDGAPMMLALGMATLVATAFGGATYGRAFIAHRASVQREIDAYLAV